jgi:hypothetical protein
MRRADRFGLALLTMGVGLSPVAAQGPDDQIVVRGTRSTLQEVDRQARAYGRAIEAVPVGGQIARWNKPICPRVTGIDRAPAALVVATIVGIARDAHVPVGPPSCRANIVVTFTPDAKALLAAIERHDPSVLSLTSLGERATLRTAALPIRWWYSAEIEGEAGEPLGNESPVLAGQLQIPTTANERYLDSYSSSLTSTKMRASMDCVAVLVDVGAATGYRLDAIAAFAAFVALARVRIGAPAPDVPSVLGLFDRDKPGEPGLSRFDAAYLAALYGARSTRTAAVQRGLIAASMVDRLDGPAIR